MYPKIFLSFVFFLILLTQVFSQHLIPYRKGKLWGYADSNGVIKIKPKYDYVDQADCELVRVKLKQKWGVLNLKTGFLVVPTVHPDVNVYCGDWVGSTLVVHTGTGDQILTHEGKPIATVQQVFPYTRGPNILVKKGEGLGLITNTGKWLLQPEQDWIDLCDGGYYIIRTGDETQYYDPSGQLIFKGKLLMHNKFENGYARIYYRVRKKGDSASLAQKKVYVTEYLGSEDGKTQVKERELSLEEKLYSEQVNILDHSGKLFIPEGYSTNYGAPTGGWLPVRGPKGMGIVDSAGTFVVPPVYDEVDASHDYILLKKNNLQGVATPGKLRPGFQAEPWRIVEPAYRYIESFSGLLYIVSVGEKHKLIEANGNQIYEDFDWISDNGKTGFTAGRKDRIYWMDEAGKMLLDMDTLRYQSSFPFDGEIAIAYRGRRAGLINRKGKEIAPPIFTAFYKEGPGLYRVHAAGNASYLHDAGIMNAEGRLVIDTVHQMAHASRDHKNLLVQDNDLWGLYDTNGTQLLPIEFTEITAIVQGYYLAHKPNPDYKYIALPVDENGNEIGERPKSKVSSILAFLVDPQGHIIKELPEYPDVYGNFMFLRNANGWMRLDGKKFWQE